MSLFLSPCLRSFIRLVHRAPGNCNFFSQGEILKVYSQWRHRLRRCLARQIWPLLCLSFSFIYNHSASIINFTSTFCLNTPLRLYLDPQQHYRMNSIPLILSNQTSDNDNTEGSATYTTTELQCCPSK